jgi:glutamate-5-semialdehyde dehydrogenase
MRIAKALLTLAKNGKAATQQLRVAPTSQKNEALLAIAEALWRYRDTILKANQEDRENGDLSPALLDRLSLEGRLEGIIADVHSIVSLPDPIGEILESRTLPSGLKIQKKRVPIGLLGVIYEARPNVTVDIATLALKTSNCVILRGGKETIRTNCALHQAVVHALEEVDLPPSAVQLIKSPERSQVKQLVKLDQYIDMIIPRGGAGLHAFCRKESYIPVITGGVGICHLFADATADLDKAAKVIINAKTKRPTVCNAIDTLLVHASIAQEFIPLIISNLNHYGVSFRLDETAWKIAHSLQGNFQYATEQDWQTEWLGLTLGIKVVHSLNEAIQHIEQYGTHHSDGILTESPEHAHLFVEGVDSAAVYVNASTYFTDGGQFGLGAEVAISTQKLHARGPMGLKELTTYKWIVEGNYNIRG